MRQKSFYCKSLIRRLTEPMEIETYRYDVGPIEVFIVFIRQRNFPFREGAYQR